MGYSLEEFGRDIVAAVQEKPGEDGREAVRRKLEDLLKDPDFLAAYCGDDAEVGVRPIWVDEDTGLRVLQHIYAEGKTSHPHDHGESWAVYGQAVEWTDMTVWERKDDGSRDGYAEIEPSDKFRLEPGMAGVFHPGDIHQIHFPDGARFIRVTGTDLGSIATSRYDADANTVETSAGRMPSGTHGKAADR